MQPLEDKYALRQKSILRNNQGMTLIELMIASGISLVVSLGISGIFIYTVQQFTIMVEMNKAQENLLWMAYHSKSVLSQAVAIDGDATDPVFQAIDGEVNDVNAAPIGNGATATAGSDANSFDLASGRRVLVADFFREWGTNSSNLLQTQIVYQRPTPSEEGIVFFDVNTPNGQAMTADFGDIFYDKVVQYDVQTLSTTLADGSNQMESAQINITTRYHKSTDQTRWNWCVPSLACANGSSSGNDASFVDLSMSLSVGFRNNRAMEKDASNKSLGIHGGIYYYRFQPPTVNF